MMEDIKKFAESMYGDMMKDAQVRMMAQKYGTVNFVINERLAGKMQISVNGVNPRLVIESYRKFREEVTKK